MSPNAVHLISPSQGRKVRSITYLTRVAEEKELHEGIGGGGTLS